MQSMQSLNTPLTRCLLLLTVVACLASVGLNATSLALPNWLSINVDSSAANANENSTHLYYSRSRGLFLTCLTDTSSPVLQLKNYAEQAKFAACFDNDLGNLNSTQVNYVGNNEDVLLLRQWQLGLQLAGGVAMALALVLLISSFVFNNATTVFVAAALCTLASLPQAASLLTFHAGLTVEMLPQASDSKNLYSGWPDSVRLATRIQFGVAYGLACASLGICLLASCMCVALGARVNSRADCDEQLDTQPKVNDAGAVGTGGPKMSAAADPYLYHPSANYANGPPSQRSNGSRLPRIPVAHRHY